MQKGAIDSNDRTIGPNAQRMFDWPEGFFERIEPALKLRGHSYSNPEKLAPWVVELSDHYTRERNQIKDIWSQPHWAAAYLAYFYPLNYLRACAVLAEGERFSFFQGLDEIYDLGSGPGTFHRAWRDRGLPNLSYFAAERSLVAKDLHKALLSDVSSPPLFVSHLPPKLSATKSLVVASYSLNEMDRVPESLYTAQSLLLIEPSLQGTSRKLLELRQKFLDRGYLAWAPCPHQKACPLLTQSKSDWCHDRIFVGESQWFSRLENCLPMKNQSLTFSYLLMRKEAPPHIGKKTMRLIGDTLYEKGKIRQMVCIDERRLFLSWLRKQGDPPRIERGALLDYPQSSEIKGNELRIKGDG